MKARRLASCENCWFNGLQNGSIGLALGYCVEHRIVLRDSGATTCGKHFRKDLPLPTSERFQFLHLREYPNTTAVVELASGEVANSLYISKDSKILKNDMVGEAVVDYGVDDTKISTLSGIKRNPSVRLEFALLNLSRSYTHRCFQRSSTWTSALNILWWIKKRLAEIPQIAAGDIRYPTTSSLSRQEDIAQWSLIMARLLFISDVGHHARDSDSAVNSLKDIAEEAAEETGKISTKKLVKWINQVGLKRVDTALPTERYRQLMAPLLERNEDF